MPPFPAQLWLTMRLSLLLVLLMGSVSPVSRVLAEEPQDSSASAKAEANSDTANSDAAKEEQQADSDPQPSETEAAIVKSDSVTQPVQKQSAQLDPVVSPGVEKSLAAVSKEIPIGIASKRLAGKSPAQPTAKASDLPQSKRLIGAIAFVMENQSQLIFRARVDTGAQSCSIHTEEVRIEDAEESMEDNVGKVVRIKLKNDREESEWVETSISRIVRVKTSEQTEERYCVSLVLVYEGFKKEVRVTLNDRSHMVYPLLLGRNFLQGDFLVDVDVSALK